MSTYDQPTSDPARFPSSFRHDLSLVTAVAPWEDLPRVMSPDHSPRVTGWGNYRTVLDGEPLFVIGFNIGTGNLSHRREWGVSEESRRALAMGSQYTWDRELLSQNVSILWRTEYDGDRLQGFSGTALCLGQISDRTCLAVCFQNFETPLYSRAVLEQGHRSPPSEGTYHARIKGGFLLPTEVRDAEILCDEPETGAAPGTHPSRQRPSTELRRSFSSHH